MSLFCLKLCNDFPKIREFSLRPPRPRDRTLVACALLKHATPATGPPCCVPSTLASCCPLCQAHCLRASCLCPHSLQIFTDISSSQRSCPWSSNLKLYPSLSIPIPLLYFISLYIIYQCLMYYQIHFLILFHFPLASQLKEKLYLQHL